MKQPGNERRQVISIRDATLLDAVLLAKLGAQTFVESYAHANTDEDMRSHVDHVFSEAARAQELADPNRATFIAETLDDQASGDSTLCATAIGYATVLRESRAEGAGFRAPAELERIYVLRSYHGQGVGASLMEACVARARKWHCDGLWLGVWETNPNAIRFYQRAGFGIIGKKTFRLGSDVQTDLVMARAL